jgi:HTH-type transcriptional regulator/antitoxin HigA
MRKDHYQELMQEFPLRPIRSDRQLDRADGIVFRLTAQKSLTRGEQDYLEVLSD